MKLQIETKGFQDSAHCSETSSINKCNYLFVGFDKCGLFGKGLEYDWDFHAYKRCKQCVESEAKEECNNQNG